MGIYRYTRSWLRHRRENLAAVSDPVVIKDEEEPQEVVPEEVAPEGDLHLA